MYMVVFGLRDSVQMFSVAEAEEQYLRGFLQRVTMTRELMG